MTVQHFSPFGETCLISFANYTIDSASGELRKDNELIKIEPQLVTFLLLLIKQQNDNVSPIVNREMMIKYVWSGKNPSDDAIRAVVKKLRDVLGDDARKPIFIKTIPTKGYLFVCETKVRSNRPTAFKKALLKYSILVLSIVTFTIAIQGIVSRFDNENTVQVSTLDVDELLADIGSEVSVHYDQNFHIIESRYELAENSLQLYLNHVDSGLRQRLSWGRSQEVTGLWSYSGKSILVSIGEGSKKRYQILSAANYQSKSLDLAQLHNTVTEDFETDSAFVTWASSDDSVLVSTNTPNSSAIDIHSIKLHEEKPNYVGRIMLDVDTVLNLRASPNDDYIAVTYLDVLKQSKVSVIDLRDLSILSSFTTNDEHRSLVWDETGSTLSFLDSALGITSFDTSTGKISRLLNLPDNIDQLLYQCGVRCFVASQRNQSKSDIVLGPTPFNTNTISAVPLLVSSYTSEYPMYDDSDNLYFVRTEEGRSLIYKRNPLGVQEVLFELPSTGNLNTISVNKDGTSMIGEIENQIFYFDIAAKSFSFITRNQSFAQYPIWLEDGKSFTYSIREDAPNSQENPEPSIHKLHLYEVQSMSHTPLTEGYQALIQVTKNSFLVLDDLGKVFQTNSNSVNELFSKSKRTFKARSEVFDASAIKAMNWLVRDEVFYKLEQIDDSVYLVAIAMDTMDKEKYRLDLLSANLQFSMDYQLKHLAFTRQTRAQGSLVRLVFNE